MKSGEWEGSGEGAGMDPATDDLSPFWALRTIFLMLKNRPVLDDFKSTFGHFVKTKLLVSPFPKIEAAMFR